MKTPTKACICCDHSNESPTKLINKVTPSKNMTPSKENVFKSSDHQKTPTKDSLIKQNPPEDSQNLIKGGEIPANSGDVTLIDNKTGFLINKNSTNLISFNKDDAKPYVPQEDKGLFSGIPSGGLFSSLATNNLGKPNEGGLFSNLSSWKKNENLLFGNLFQVNNNGAAGNTAGNFLSLNKLKSQETGKIFYSFNYKMGLDEENDDDSNHEECKSPEIKKEESTGKYDYKESFDKITQVIIFYGKRLKLL